MESVQSFETQQRSNLSFRIPSPIKPSYKYGKYVDTNAARDKFLYSWKKSKIPHSCPKNVIPIIESREDADKDQDEISQWQNYLKFCQENYGKNHSRTTDCMIQLGHAYMREQSFREALATFKNVVRLRKSVLGNDHLSVGKALDCVGRAAASMEEYDWGLLALYEALHIRYKHLGPWHVDVADTLNNIAGIFYKMDKIELAEEAYMEVISVRKAVWGSNHPSVAVTSCSVGKIQLRRSNLSEAYASYNEALRIYRVALNLKDSSPIVKKVLKNIARTERLMVSMNASF